MLLTTIVDQDIDPSSKELRSLLDLRLNVRYVSEIANGGTEAR